MEPHKLRVYADTSVFGGILDPEYGEARRAFFDQVRSGRFRLVTSPAVQAEVSSAPASVQELLQELAPIAEIVDVSERALSLQQAYLEAKIVTPQMAVDALHVALATVAECAMIVSWNFRHIVHFQKIRLYNAVNVLNGYLEVAIHSPQEVIAYEE